MTLFKGKKIHFIGIGGVGVNALAKYALQCGCAVSGSDAKFSKLCKELADEGADIYEGIKPAMVDCADAVVFSSAIKPDHPELARARELKITVFERQEFLREVSRGFKNVVGIAGTHGKTTTTAMLAHILFKTNKKYVGMIGGDSVDYGNFVNNSFGANDIFIVEACEYKRNFLSLKPTVAVVTNVECDHPDCYSDYESVKQAFDEYLLSAPSRIYLKTDNGNNWLIEKWENGMTVSYGAELENGKCDFYCDGKKVGQIKLKDGGVYNFKNATFAIISATALGVSIEESIQALATFNGVGRRFEHTGNINGVPIYFDFAHHPTEISCVLGRAGEYGKILAVFQPHTYSRTKAYFENFVDVFGDNKNIDSPIFMPTYSAREKFDKDFEVDSLAVAIKNKYGKDVCVASDVDLVLKLVLESAKSHGIVLFIGAGDIYDLKDKLKYD